MEPQVFTFRANSMQEALQLVRQQLGDDAAVVATRRIRKWGIWPTQAVEVHATRDVKVQSRLLDGAREQPPSPSPAIRTGEKRDVCEVAATGAEAGRSPSLGNRGGTSGALPQRTDAGDRRSSASYPGPLSSPGVETGVRPGTAAHQQSLTPVATELMIDLLEHGVAPDVAKRLLVESLRRCSPSQQHDAWMLRVALHQTVARKMRTGGSVESPDGKQQVLALVGPTGVGKTTTLAKIAAAARYDMGLRVGFLSLDTFRMGAVDQLRQYAELITAPVEVARSPDEVTGAIQRLHACDLVLIDTAGRAPRDQRQLRHLAALLKGAGSLTVQLVLSACSTVDHAQESLERYACVSPQQIVVTKLDEAVRFGSWMEWMMNSPLPIAYLTTGQRVPEDIVVATPRRIARELLGLD